MTLSDRNYYAEEKNVIEWSGKSSEIFWELEERFGFLGGSFAEYLKYHHRGDLPADMWKWVSARDVKAYAGLSVVLKKGGPRQRKLLMQCASNYAWSDVRSRANLGLHGGTALGSIYAPADQWAMGLFDESNAFSHVLTPPWMWTWCAGPPLPVSYTHLTLPTIE